MIPEYNRGDIIMTHKMSHDDSLEIVTHPKVTKDYQEYSFWCPSTASKSFDDFSYFKHEYLSKDIMQYFLMKIKNITLWEECEFRTAQSEFCYFCFAFLNFYFFYFVNWNLCFYLRFINYINQYLNKKLNSWSDW